MRARALCDPCRRQLLKRPDPISPFQFAATDDLFRASGDLLEGKRQTKPRAFVGSSKEALNVARILQQLLADDLTSVVWDKDEVFGLGDVLIESLEDAVLGYEYGIFVFTIP
jgi:predicted nucleotide-binding protein